MPSKSNLLAVSTYFDPAIQLGTHKQVMEDKVLFELYKSGEKVPTQQQILQYREWQTQTMISVLKSVTHDSGLDLFFKRFEKHFGSNLTAEVAHAEKALPLCRQASVSILDNRIQRLRGFIRIFDGSINPIYETRLSLGWLIT